MERFYALFVSSILFLTPHISASYVESYFDFLTPTKDSRSYDHLDYIKAPEQNGIQLGEKFNNPIDFDGYTSHDGYTSDQESIASDTRKKNTKKTKTEERQTKIKERNQEISEKIMKNGKKASQKNSRNSRKGYTSELAFF